ncbi:hypothetical protein [Anaeromyxobacter sp. PSR-1]|uniref:hypothetical protein n=1 Tax=unclassified Anaeromyxobacter TaxID=2620896 RepID=UPI0005E4B7CD|nr:hypothetical protein [Anaeromyxobacter sp. PSR-1]GAO03512.1 hypothetical protein PSR1_02396 [Anaeromyxobacter sp. PSR-1]
MKTLTKLALTLIAVAGLQACDPYEDENKGTPSVVNVIATDGGAAVEGTNTGTSWTVSSPSSTVIFVKTNPGKLLDGASIQSSPTDCTPAGGWLSVNGAGPGNWMSCYYPQSPASFEGASVVLYPGPSISDVDSWFSLTELAAGIYNLAGTVSDKQGHPLAIDVNVFVNDLAAAQSDTAGTEITVDFSDAGDNMTNVQLWEAPDVSGAPGTFAAVATTSPYVKTGVAVGATYWYKVTADTAGFPTTAASFETAPVSVTTEAP